MYNVRTTKAEAERTRATIIAAAVPMFAERGWAATTFADLGAAVGMTRGAVHHHFADKSELLSAALREQWQQWSEPVLAPLQDGPDPAAALSEFVAGYLRLLATEPRFRALAVLTTQAPDGGLDGSRLTDHNRVLDRWREAIERCLRAGRRPSAGVRSGGFVLLTALVGATRTAATQPELLPGRAAAAAIARELARTAVHLAGSPPRTGSGTRR